MPDVQSLLLALYQQILGVAGVGAVAREQSALEGAAAQRFVLSGITVSPTGVISTTVPPNFPFSAAIWTPSGGTGTISGNLVVTGTTTLQSTLGVTGVATFQSSVIGNGLGSFKTLLVAPASSNIKPAEFDGSDSQTSGVVASFVSSTTNRSSVLHFSDSATYNLGIGADNVGGFAVWTNRFPGVAGTPILTVSGAGNGTVGGNWQVGGVFSVLGLGTHSMVVSGVGTQQLVIANTAAGTSNQTQLCVGNDASNSLFALTTFASNFTGAANLTRLSQAGAGLRMEASAATGVIDFWTNGIQRWMMTSFGALVQGTAATGNTYLTQIAGAMELGNAGTAAASPLAFKNANGYVGTISTSGTATAYNTSSDKRLKLDRGLASDTSVLQATEIHDYHWLSDGMPARGVFAQDAYRVAPWANTPGSDARDDHGNLVRPWQTDYSKYVPELIVGWQQHAAELAALRAELAALKGLH